MVCMLLSFSFFRCCLFFVWVGFCFWVVVFLGFFFGLFVFAFILVLWFLSVCFCFLSSFSGFGFWGFFKV